MTRDQGCRADRGVLAQLFFAVSGAGNSTTLVLILTELTGFYALSTVLLIRKQLPPKYRRGLPPCTRRSCPALQDSCVLRLLHSDKPRSSLRNVHVILLGWSPVTWRHPCQSMT